MVNDALYDCVFPFGRRDEEADIGEFRVYLTTLRPEDLWDIRSHLDPDRFPRRREAVLREMERRGLFFVTPYSEREQRLRRWLGAFTAIVMLAAFLHLIAGIPLDPPLYERLPFFTDLAVGSPKAARLLCIVLLPMAVVSAIGAGLAAVVCLYLWRRRFLGRDTAGLAIAAALGLGLLLNVMLR